MNEQEGFESLQDYWGEAGLDNEVFNSARFLLLDIYIYLCFFLVFVFYLFYYFFYTYII